MTTPQNPDDGTTPQDPSDPQNPYGTPPPPPPPPPYDPAAPAAPPTTAIPAAPPPYADPNVTSPNPMPAPYGDPSSGNAMPPPAAPAYGQPAAPVQQPYPQPSYPQYGTQPAGEPGKGMAIAALIISFFGCIFIGTLVAIPLAIVVLVRSRGGQNHGKGLAIAAIVVSLVTLALPIGLLAAGVNYVNNLSDVNDLKAGDCITAHGLTDKNSDTIDTIHKVGCTTKHDGEVLATSEVTAELAKDISKMDPQATCAPAIEAAGKTAVVTEDITVTALTVTDPKAGDNIACVAYSADGSKLTSRLGS